MLKLLLERLQSELKEGCIPTGIILLLLGMGAFFLACELSNRHIYLGAIPAAILSSVFVGAGMVMLLSCFVRDETSPGA